LPCISGLADGQARPGQAGSGSFVWCDCWRGALCNGCLLNPLPDGPRRHPIPFFLAIRRARKSPAEGEEALRDPMPRGACFETPEGTYAAFV
jgi:hypothetical protein